MSKCDEDTKYDRTLIYGLENIAKYLRVSVPTARRWYKLHEFPMCKTPDGRYMTSTALGDAWITARGNFQRRARS